MSNVNKELVEKIKLLANQGKYPKEISKILNISYGNALIIYKREGFILEGSGGKNRKVTKNPFINDEKSNYFLGLLAADGGLSSSKCSIYLQLKDLDLLKEFKDFIEPTLNIYHRINEAGSLMGIVTFGNIEVWNYLNNLGITPKKSKTIEYKGVINWNFIRGVFDGDGSISKQEPKITTASIKFKNQLCSFLKEEGLNIKVFTKGINNDIFDIYVRGNSRFDFFYKMYNNASVYLNRKYVKYGAALKKFKVQNTG